MICFKENKQGLKTDSDAINSFPKHVFKHRKKKNTRTKFYSINSPYFYPHNRNNGNFYLCGQFVCKSHSKQKFPNAEKSRLIIIQSVLLHF